MAVKKHPALHAAAKAVVRRDSILRGRAKAILDSSTQRTFPKPRAVHHVKRPKGNY